jgi:hypothetical protein
MEKFSNELKFEININYNAKLKNGFRLKRIRREKA